MEKESGIPILSKYPIEAVNKYYSIVDLGVKSECAKTITDLTIELKNKDALNILLNAETSDHVSIQPVGETLDSYVQKILQLYYARIKAFIKADPKNEDKGPYLLVSIIPILKNPNESEIPLLYYCILHEH